MASSEHKQAHMEGSGDRDVTEQVVVEHEQLRSLHAAVKAATTGEQKEDTAQEFVKALVQHSGREEAVLYPFIRKRLAHGPDYVDRSVAAHQRLNEETYQLLNMDYAKSPQLYETLLATVCSELFEHMADEEKVILPDLSTACSKQELIDVNKQFVKVITTTRPHPLAPREGTAAAIAQAMSVPLDKVMDMWHSAMRKPSDPSMQYKPSHDDAATAHAAQSAGKL